MIVNNSRNYIGRPIADIAVKLGISLNAKSRKQRLPKSKTTVAANETHIQKGGRNSMLASLAGALQRRGVSPSTIEEVLQLENQQRCSPPLDVAEVTAIAKSITTRYPHATANTYQNTDVGNADRFEAQHRGNVHYISERNEWVSWDGERWRFCGYGPMQELAKMTASTIKDEAEAAPDEGRREALMKHWYRTETVGKLDSMLKLASSIASIVVHDARLDSDPMLLGVANGVIDLETGALLPPDRVRLMTRQSSVVFDSTAECPLFISFLDRIFAGDIELIAYIQRMCGYALTGLTTEQCFFFFFGSGANGKSTLINIMSAVAGSDYATTTPTATLMVKRGGISNDVARLKGMRMVFANELDESSLLDEQLVKQLVSGDEITARYLYEEFIVFRAQLKLIFAGNHKPVIRGRDEGMWRRTKLVPFGVTIPESERDPKLEDKLRAELPGILNWILEGTRAWRRIGLKTPRIVEQLTREYRQEMDVLGQWIDEHCSVDPKFEAQAGSAYISYRSWCLINGFRPMTSAAFYREMALKFEKKRRSSANFFVGIKCNF